MLIYGQTFNEAKGTILGYIKTSRALAREANKAIKLYPDMADDLLKVIDQQHKDIAESMVELRDLEKWRFTYDVPKDEPYQPESVLKKRESMSLEEWNDYQEYIMELEEEIAKLEDVYEEQLSSRQTA